MATLEEDVKRFLDVGYGYGYGSGSGYGYGDGSGYGDGDGSGYGSDYGYGDGSGCGSGYGYGSGSGSGYGYGSGYGDDDGGYGYGDGSDYGSGYGSGSGYGLKEYAGRKVYIIDGVPTLIDSVHNNYAKGSIIKDDLTLEPCFIAKVCNFFAHGKKLHEAVRDALAKYDESLPIEERIAYFKKLYPTLDTRVMGVDLFDWHHVLTGSCRMGREEFCKSHELDPKKTMLSVKEFIDLTVNAYGGANIRVLAKAYNYEAHS